MPLLTASVWTSRIIGNTGIKTPSYAATPAVVEEMVNINQLRWT
nr:MAG TPA: hypothetical protein [Caudoviricetes sp.]